MTIDITNLSEEAIRLGNMGVIDVTFTSKAGKVTDKTITVVCVGSGIDEEERDVLLFTGPYGGRHRHTARAIPATWIKSVERAEVQSFDRHAMNVSKRNISGLNPKNMFED